MRCTVAEGVAVDLAGFNQLPAGEAERELLACCASPAWARTVAAGRPYADLSGVRAAADAALAGLDWAEIERALAAHPRIGERPSGTGRQDGWSRTEQAGVADADAATRAALAGANRAYEQRFGHIYLVFASGRSDVELLAAARARLTNDPQTERSVVRTELGKITRRRLERLIGTVGIVTGLSTHVLDTGRGEPAAGVPVRLDRRVEGGWLPVATGTTGADGRLRDWVPAGEWRADTYRLVFDAAAYLGPGAFFPEVTVVFAVVAPDRHHHVPLLLSPFGYTTYRGS